MALGLVRGPLPAVESRWLCKYYEYLAARLSLPFEARCTDDISGLRQLSPRVTAVALVDPDGNPSRENSGLTCTVRSGTLEAEVPLVELEVEEGSPNFELVEDYWYWFWNWRFDPRI